MKFLKAIFVLFLFNNISAQNDSLHVYRVSNYIIEASFYESLLSSKCDCCSNVKYDSCTLFKIVIKNSFLLNDNSVYNSNKDLENVRYLVVPNEFKENFNLDTLRTSFLITKNSCNPKFISYHKMLSQDEFELIKKDYNKPLAYISGNTNCYDLNIFQRILLKIGIFKKTIYNNASKINPDNTVFGRKIAEVGSREN